MAYCNNCGASNKDGSKFCGVCGEKIEHIQQEEKKESKSNDTRKVKYEGEIHKCPNCGAVLKSFSEKCSECGYELRGTSGAESVSDFANRYENAKTNEEKVSLIRTFVIPNTKEDILEFAILASSNIDEDLSYNENVVVSGGAMSSYDVSKAWVAKFEQAYQKAQLLLAGTPELENLEKMYTQKTGRINTFKKISYFNKGSKFIIAGVVMFIGVLMTIIGEFAGSASGNPDSPFYMLAMLGFLFIIGPVVGLLILHVSNR